MVLSLFDSKAQETLLFKLYIWYFCYSKKKNLASLILHIFVFAFLSILIKIMLV